MIKYFVILFAVISMAAPAWAYNAPETGFYDGPSGQALYYTKGDHMAQPYTFIGNISEGNGGGSADQKQKQKQQQSQFQAQSQSMKNEIAIGNGYKNFSPEANAGAFAGAVGQAGDNNLSVNIENPVNRRELPGYGMYHAPAPGEYRGPWDRNIYHVIRPWTAQKVWTAEDIDALPKGGEVLSSCVFKFDASKAITLVQPREVKEGDVSWFIVADADNPIRLWGKAANQALKDGATECAVIKFVPYNMTKGSGFNIGIGGGISAVNGGSNDNYGGSVGPGMGYGNFSVGPVEKAKMALQCFHGKPQK